MGGIMAIASIVLVGFNMLNTGWQGFFSMLWGLGLSGFLLWAGIKWKAHNANFLLLFLAVQTALNSVQSLIMLAQVSLGFIPINTFSDATSMQSMTGIPAAAWSVFWVFCSLLMLAITIFSTYGRGLVPNKMKEGLVHVSEMTWSKRMKHPSKLVKPGDEVETVVISVNPSDRRISLGMKQLLENPWENLSERYPTGAIVEGRVRNLTDFGAFIEIEDGIDGLVHVSNLSWTKRVKHPSEVLKKGEKVKAVVLGVEPENRRLSLGVKQLQPDVWETFFTQHRVGDVVHGKVLRTAQFGAFVEIAEGVEGLCHVSEAVGPDGHPITLEQGQEHDFKIIKMNVEEKKVGLSIRAVGEEASRAEVEHYKTPSHDRGHGHEKSSSSQSSSTTTLGDLVNWDKFRR